MRVVIVVLLAIALAPAPEGAADLPEIPADATFAFEQPPDAWAELAAPVDLVDTERPRPVDTGTGVHAGRDTDRPPLRPPRA